MNVCTRFEVVTERLEENADNDDIDALVRKAEKDLEYFRMVELARRHGVPLPVQR